VTSTIGPVDAPDDWNCCLAANAASTRSLSALTRQPAYAPLGPQILHPKRLQRRRARGLGEIRIGLLRQEVNFR
jgi:hypothetical protein